MKFGIFYELQLPRPWEPDDERKLYQNALTQVELADKLGYDYAWEVEHHFLEEYSHSPAPEVFLAAASQRTKNIRLGHGIVQLTTNPPQRVAERIACLDLVSNGRVEFGTGESGSVTELGGFGRQMEEKREIWEDALRCIIPMFEDKGVEHDTKWHKMPLRNVLPKPVQKPHPPILVGGAFPHSARRAIRYADGWMPQVTAEATTDLGELIPRFRQMAAEAGREPDSLSISVWGQTGDLERMKRFRDLGADRVATSLDSAKADVILPVLDRWAEIIRDVNG